MINKVLGFRKMVGLTQEQTAKELGISTNSFANKEKGRTDFTESEMKLFLRLITRGLPNTRITDIFFVE